MSNLASSGTFTLGDHKVNRIGYGTISVNLSGAADLSSQLGGEKSGELLAAFALLGELECRHDRPPLRVPLVGVVFGHVHTRSIPTR